MPTQTAPALTDSLDRKTLTILGAATATRSAAHAAGWEALAERVRTRVTRFVHGRPIPSYHGLEDLQQDVLVHVFQNLPRFEVRGSDQFWEWVRQVTENKLRDLWRRAAAQKRGGRRTRVGGDNELLAELPTDAPGHSMVARCNELRQRFVAAIAGLRDHHQRVLALRVLDGRNFAEIAAELGYGKEGSARVLFHRAMREFQQLGFAW